MAVKLYDYQLNAIQRLKSGSILRGGVGSGKSRTAIGWYFLKVCQGCLPINGVGNIEPMKHPKNLYIITTAKKRDSLDWESELVPFLLSTNKDICIENLTVIVDSWNNIIKYKDIKNSVFIFDEQRLIGSGAWVKTFYKIARPKQQNKWIILTATPGDTWMDYIPVFVANGFYKNRTEFISRHVVYNNFTKYPKIDRYIECQRLVWLRNKILVNMEYNKKTIQKHHIINTPYNTTLYYKVLKDRWNIFENRPIKNISELCYTLRKVVNSDIHRQLLLREYIPRNRGVIIFYNFNYELDILITICKQNNFIYSEWNGHKHEDIPNSDAWVYLVQYTAGAEAWECIKTDTIIFYSQNYSYKIMHQAAGRIDRNNTPFEILHYYHLQSDASIDRAISKAINEKKTFNELSFSLATKTHDIIEGDGISEVLC